MLLKILKTSALVAITATVLNAGSFNAQAEKDRLALEAYTVAKFKDPVANKDNFFPYSTDNELKNNIVSDIKAADFAIGNYAFSRQGKFSYDEIKEMPPYDELIEAGEGLYNKKFKNGKSFSTCFSSPTAGSYYPQFSDKRDQVITLTQAINECLVDNGEKKWKETKGKMAHLQGYMANESKEMGKKVKTRINSKAAAEAYERGKEIYYTEGGYLKLSCATCHVQGAGKRVRNESMSQLLGHTTHFPVFRLKWGKGKVENGLGTLERRMAGCIKDTGKVPPKTSSKTMKELLYFMSYMSNGMNIDGPDIRK